MSRTPEIEPDEARRWVERWERHQSGYMSGRDGTFELVFTVVERLVGSPARVMDLGSGPGTLSARMLNRWPDAEVIALDLDPVLVDLGRAADGGRIRWLEADLRQPDWDRDLAGSRVDAVVSAIALHYLDAEHLPHVYGGIARVLREGGVFVDCDTMRGDPANPRLSQLMDELRTEQWARAFDGGQEDFQAWWAALRSDPRWEESFAERDRRFGSRPIGVESSIAERLAALRGAGFVEVDTLSHDVDTRVVVAIAP